MPAVCSHLWVNGGSYLVPRWKMEFSPTQASLIWIGNLKWHSATRGEKYRIAVDYNNFSKASNLYIKLA